MKPTKRPRPESAREYVQKRIRAFKRGRKACPKGGKLCIVCERGQAIQFELVEVLRRLPGEGGRKC